MTVDAFGLREFEEAVIRVCFRATPAEEDLARLKGDRRRWLLYRSMVRLRLENMIRAAMPRFFGELEDAVDGRLFSQFFDQRAVHSRYIRDCVPEFVGFVEAECSSVLTLNLRNSLQLECARWTVRDLVCDETPFVDFDFEKRPVVNAAHRVVVHAVASDSEESDTTRYLVVYRDTESMDIREMRMNDFAFHLWDAWSSRDEIAMDSAKRVAEREGLAIDGEFLNRMCDVLAEFVDQGLVLGSRRDTASTPAL